MATNLQSGKETQLALPLSTTDTDATLFSVPTVTSGRLFITDGIQRERVSYTGITGSKVTWLTRNLSVTWDPATGGTWLAFIAGSTVRLVAMHDQIVDKTADNTYKDGTTQTFDKVIAKSIKFTGTTTPWLQPITLTTTQRNALNMTWVTAAIIYNSTTTTYQQYIWGTWSDIAISALAPMLLTGDQTASGIKTFNDIMKKRSTTDIDTIHYVRLWTRYENNAIPHSSQWHITQLLRWDMSGEGTLNDWGWGFQFWPNGRPYLYMIDNSTTIWRSDWTLNIASPTLSFNWWEVRRGSSDAEALAWSSTTTALSPYQWNLITKHEVKTFSRNTIWVQTITHSLWRVPKAIRINARCVSTIWSTEMIISDWVYDGTSQYCVYALFNGTTWTTDKAVYISKNYAWTLYELIGTIQNVTSTQFQISWTNFYANNTYAQSINGIIELS